MSTPDPVPAEPAPTPETPCQHQFGGAHDIGYSCKLCNAAGKFNPDSGAIEPA